jgi:hypothetical protein
MGLLMWSVARAEPWLAPGDLAIRHDIEILADLGIIRAPITTWPLSVGDLANELRKADPATLDPAAQASLQRLQQYVQQETRAGERTVHARGAIAPERRTLRSFEATPREDAEVEAGIRWTGLRFSYRLQATYAPNPDDGQEWRADGSYLGVAVANWMLAAGVQDRWWGPAWESSLILSNNARPVPAISMNRNLSNPVQVPGFRWVGSWTTSFMMGQLEDDRDVPDALLFGARFAFRPVPSLEIGLSRTAQWCGEDRPCDLETFTNLLLGRDNKTSGLPRDKEPGNQLAGGDLRWTGGPHGRHYALYGQMIGEDEAGGTPSKFIGRFGAEYWGQIAFLDSSYRVYAEAADTASDFLGTSQFNIAYEHSIYTDGYRYRGRAIGDSMDNDGLGFSIGALLLRNDARQWSARLQFVELNRDDEQKPVSMHSVSQRAADLWNIEVGHKRVLGPGTLSAGLGFERLEQQDSGTVSDDVTFYAQYSLGM